MDIHNIPVCVLRSCNPWVHGIDRDYIHTMDYWHLTWCCDQYVHSSTSWYAFTNVVFVVTAAMYRNNEGKIVPMHSINGYRGKSGIAQLILNLGTKHG